MGRTAAFALVCSATLLVSACGSSTSDEPPAASAAAPPQAAEVSWIERSPDKGAALVFRTRRFAVTEDGWEAEVEIENATEITWELAGDPVIVQQSFGIMLFATGDLAEVERRGSDGDLPELRPARTFQPALPLRLSPGERWEATVGADGSLAAGRHVRIVFGPLVAESEPPTGMPDRFVWITDHAYRLRP